MEKVEENKVYREEERKMSKQTKSYRGIEESLIKGLQHLAIDTGRAEGDLVNEAIMLLLKAHEKKKKANKKEEGGLEGTFL